MVMGCQSDNGLLGCSNGSHTSHRQCQYTPPHQIQSVEEKRFEQLQELLYWRTLEDWQSKQLT